MGVPSDLDPREGVGHGQGLGLEGVSGRGGPLRRLGVDKIRGGVAMGVGRKGGGGRQGHGLLQSPLRIPFLTTTTF